MSIDRHLLTGNITRDAELKESKAGKPYASFGLAVNVNKDKTTFYTVTVFGKYGETMGPYLTKGRHATVDAKKLTMNVVDGNGYLDVVADNIDLDRPKEE